MITVAGRITCGHRVQLHFRLRPMPPRRESVQPAETERKREGKRERERERERDREGVHAQNTPPRVVVRQGNRIGTQMRAYV